MIRTSLPFLPFAVPVYLTGKLLGSLRCQRYETLPPSPHSAQVETSVINVLRREQIPMISDWKTVTDHKLSVPVQSAVTYVHGRKEYRLAFRPRLESGTARYLAKRELFHLLHNDDLCIQSVQTTVSVAGVVATRIRRWSPVRSFVAALAISQAAGLVLWKHRAVAADAFAAEHCTIHELQKAVEYTNSLGLNIGQRQKFEQAITAKINGRKSELTREAL